MIQDYSNVNSSKKQRVNIFSSIIATNLLLNKLKSIQ